MLQVSVHPETEARLRRLAEQSGKDVAAYVSELLERAASAQGASGIGAADEFDAALDELFAADTRPLPGASLTYSRREIYFDRD